MPCCYRIFASIFSGAFLLVNAANAEIYKCGNQYRNTPCKASHQGEKIAFEEYQPSASRVIKAQKKNLAQSIIAGFDCFSGTEKLNIIHEFTANSDTLQETQEALEKLRPLLKDICHQREAEEEAARSRRLQEEALNEQKINNFLVEAQTYEIQRLRQEINNGYSW